MPYRIIALLMAFAAATLVAGCAEPRPAAPATLAAPGPVVSFDGVRDIAFGVTAQELTARGQLSRPTEACGPVLVGLPETTPVFADDRLVLLWVNPPATTPEGIGVGSPLADVRTVYPRAEERPAPTGSHRFDALMVTDGDRAYVFLHDGEAVVKAIAGFTAYAHRLLDSGFGSC